MVRRSSIRLGHLAVWILLASALLGPRPADAKSESGGMIDPGAVLGFGVRAHAMGNAYTALVDDATGVFWNPAALDVNRRKEIFGQYSRTYFENTSYNMIAYKHPLGRIGALGAGLIHEGVDDLTRRDVNAINIGAFNVSKMNAMFCYGKRIAGGFYLGIGAHIFRRQIAEFSGAGVGLDVGGLYRFGDAARSNIPTDRLSLGFNIQNLVRPSIKLNRVADRIPTNLKLGAAYKLFDWMRFAADVDLSLKGTRRFHFGTEWQPVRWLALRAGLDHEDPVFGFGFRHPDLRVDYSYRPRQDLDQNFQRVGLSYEFGKSGSSAALIRPRPILKARPDGGRNRKLTDAWKLIHLGQIAFDYAVYPTALELWWKAKLILGDNGDLETKLNRLRPYIRIEEVYGGAVQLFEAGEYERAYVLFKAAAAIAPRYRSVQEYLRRVDQFRYLGMRETFRQ